MVPGIRPQNLNDIFQAAAKQARQRRPDLSHNQKVTLKKRQLRRSSLFFSFSCLKIIHFSS
jgi:hypothetical protein